VVLPEECPRSDKPCAGSKFKKVGCKLPFSHSYSHFYSHGLPHHVDNVPHHGSCACMHACAARSNPCMQVADSQQCFTSFQELKVQEKPQCLAMGSLPCAITVVVQDELADSAHPGGG
jgi:DNA replicative helicase MCM subunit Mcm2 (Cdc46/Mcm family)